jgi:hypothetical protein
VLIDQQPAAGADIFRLVTVQADRAQIVFESGGIGLRVVTRRAIFFEECGRDLVDLDVGALRGENGRDEQFERVGKVQFAMRVRVNTGQGGAERFCALGGRHLFHLAAKKHKEHKKMPGPSGPQNTTNPE